MRVTSFGEVLWDDFPTGKKLGGAPINVVTRIRALGWEAGIISRVGRDENGEEILRQVESKNLSTSLIQVDDQQATSLVKVTLNNQGSASYEIVYPCAWDRIEPDENACKYVAESDAFVYGSLATRDEVSRKTLDLLLQHAKLKIFDVNMRTPHYEYSRLIEMIKAADIVKMNDDELYEVARAAGSPYHSLEQNVCYLTEKYDCNRMCITLGQHGAVYYDKGKFNYHGGYRIEVADTVGSGDNFLAGFIFKLLQNAPADEILCFACALGAMVASRHGPNPVISLQEIEQFINPV